MSYYSTQPDPLARLLYLEKYICSRISKCLSSLFTCYAILHEKVNSFYWRESEANAAKIIRLPIINIERAVSLELA